MRWKKNPAEKKCLLLFPLKHPDKRLLVGKSAEEFLEKEILLFITPGLKWWPERNRWSPISYGETTLSMASKCDNLGSCQNVTLPADSTFHCNCCVECGWVGVADIIRYCLWGNYWWVWQLPQSKCLCCFGTICFNLLFFKKGFGGCVLPSFLECALFKNNRTAKLLISEPV